MVLVRHPTLEGNVENQVGNGFFVFSIYGLEIEMSIESSYEVLNSIGGPF